VLLFPALAVAEPLRVFVSVLPMQTFVEKIGREHVDVRTMVQPGYSPATYDPTPQQIAALAGARLYVRTGVPFEHAWMDRIRSANPDMDILDVRTGLELLTLEKHHHRDDDHQHHDANEEDPHVWTSPRLVIQVAAAIRDRLSSLDPENKEAFHRNHAAFTDELDALDRELHTLLDPLTHRRFLVFHPSWGYFAQAYGLQQVAIEHEGKQPGARALARLIDTARAQQIRVVFVQPQFDRRQAQQVAEAIGGEVIAVDPLSADYIDNLKQVAKAFVKALQP
jgi:zinc transport system substrate-binding protein